MMLYKLEQIKNEYKEWISENENIMDNCEKKGTYFFLSIIVLCQDVKFIGTINADYEILRCSKEKKELRKTIAKAQGEYILVIDEPGELEGKVLNIMMNLQRDDKARLLYADEDELIDGERCNPFFKPDWSPHTLCSFFYLGSAVCYQKNLIELLIERLNGMWNRETIANFLVQEIERSQVRHCSEVLYHNIQNKRIWRENTRDRKEVFSYDGLVSIIIPSKDHYEVLNKCIESIKQNTINQAYEIIVVDNGSKEECRRQIEQYLQKIGGKYCYEKEKFNFSRMCNKGVKEATGDYLLFLNDDTEILQPDWLDNMLELAILPYSGAVGAKLLYPGEKRIQHVGIVNLQSGPSHAFFGELDEECYFGRNRVTYNYIAVTGACLLVEKKKYLYVDGMDERLPVAYNDVDLCFKLYEAGWYNTVCNRTKIRHYESLSRGMDAYDEKKLRRLLGEKEILFTLHPKLQGVDPFYNKNLVTDKENFGLNIPQYRVEKENIISLHIWNRHNYENLKITTDVIIYDKDIVIEGWCLQEKCSEGGIERKLVIQTKKSRALLIDVDIVERKDVQQIVGNISANVGFKLVIPATLRDILKNAIRIGIWERLEKNKNYFGELDKNFEWEKLQKRELAVQIPRNSLKEWKKMKIIKKIRVQSNEREYQIQMRMEGDLNKLFKALLLPKQGGILYIDMERQQEMMVGTIKRAQVHDIAEYEIFVLEEDITKGKLFYYKINID